MRAMDFEEKIKSSGIGLIKECWREKKTEGWIDEYGIERKRFYNRYGWEAEEGEDSVRDLEQRKREMREWEKERTREEGFSKIIEARYNKRYKEILAEEACPGTSKGAV